MSYLEELKKNITIENSKGGRYYATTYSANLDVFAGISRYNKEDKIITKFYKAICEDETLALANLLYILDIRGGKGERRLFKIIFKYLCEGRKEAALKILYKIPEYGRWDYILEGLDTPIDKEVITLIKTQLEKDKNSENPSLLAKWLPSHKTHGIKNEMAQKLIMKLGMTEEEYRKTLSSLRKKLRLIETNLSSKEYKTINFEKVPTKAMLKYHKSFVRNSRGTYIEYLRKVEGGESKINTTGLYCYEIIRKIVKDTPAGEKLYDLMWKNQKDILKGYNKNILVMADTSGSMTFFNYLPYSTAIGLAIYIAERNTGAFKNHFMTFSSEPTIQEVIGKTITEKVNNIEEIIDSTDIDKAFELLLNTAVEKNISQEELPEALIIISDMEFDYGVESQNNTNFEGWKKTFEEKGYKLPKIIFWNVAGCTGGMPATKYDQDVVMVSGFSTLILENLLTLEKYDPMEIMVETLEKYINVLQND